MITVNVFMCYLALTGRHRQKWNK